MKPVPLRVVERGFALLKPGVLFRAVIQNEIEAGKRRKHEEVSLEEEGGRKSSKLTSPLFPSTWQQREDPRDPGEFRKRGGRSCSLRRRICRVKRGKSEKGREGR